MDLQLSITGKRDLTRQIYRQLRERILDGRLNSGERLPPSRELAEELKVTRKTVTNVYDLLMSEGFLETRVGSGTFVASGIPRARDTRLRSKSPLRVRESWGRLSPLLTSGPRRLPFDFSVGVPDTSRLPFSLWRSLLGRSARILSRNADSYAEPQGYAPLRDAIAKYTGFTRAVVCNASDVIVTNGAQQAFALISYVLVDQGTTVAVEHPGYDRARRLFELHGARIAEIPIDEQGLIVDALPRHAKILYVTPSHQFPLGVRMSLTRRLALLEWAARHGAAVIEDDYDTEFRFEARPLDSLQSLDRHGVVLYVGTFSKVLFPGVRTGFIVAPALLKDTLVAARQIADWHGSLLTQATLARFIDEGHLARHIRKMRKVYEERRTTLLECLNTMLVSWLRPWPSVAGLHIATDLKNGADGDKVAASAERAGVGVHPLGKYGLAFGYGTIEAKDIEEGIRRLRRLFEES